MTKGDQEIVEAYRMLARAYALVARNADSEDEGISGSVAAAVTAASRIFGVEKVRRKLLELANDPRFWELQRRALGQQESLIIRPFE